jgi:hypothetical protein
MATAKPAFDRQTVYNTVLFGLRKQGVKSTGEVINPYGQPARVCLYRDGQGHACAAGQLFPDEDYDPEMEMNRVTTPVVAKVLNKQFAEALTHDQLSFIARLQRLHDNHMAPNEMNELASEWENKMQIFAVECGLVYTPREQQA